MIYVHVILCTQEPLCVHAACMLVTVRAICRALTKVHKISFKHCGSNIDSADWKKTEKTTVNLINKNDNKHFQYPAAVALNHEEKKDLERISKIKPFINKYECEGTNYPSEKKMIGKNLIKLF